MFGAVGGPTSFSFEGPKIASGTPVHRIIDILWSLCVNAAPCNETV